MRTLSPNLDAFARVRGSQNQKQFAARIGVNDSTLSRVLAGDIAPSARFIAATLSELPVQFHEVFDIVDEAGK